MTVYGILLDFGGAIGYITGMARLARIVVPGVPHHVVQRGNRRQTVFFGDEDYAAYLSMLAERAQGAEVAIWAYCLMPNHIHLIVVPETADGLRATLGETHRRYTRRINSREGWQGHLWQERFASYPLDPTHIWSAARYVERNPVRAGLVDKPQDWAWSSARAHLAGKDDEVVTVAPLLEQFGDWGEYLAEADEATAAEMRSHEKTGRPLGEPDFVSRLEELTGRRLARRKPGPKPRE